MQYGGSLGQEGEETTQKMQVETAHWARLPIGEDSKSTRITSPDERLPQLISDQATLEELEAFDRCLKEQ